MKLRHVLPCFVLIAVAAPSVEVPAVERLVPPVVIAEVEQKLEVAAPFGDNMVLQRDMPVPVWGRAAAGTEVTVDFAGQHKTTVANAAGRWMVQLDPLAVSEENRVLTVTGRAGKLEFKQVLVGEVWVCAGQSNMEMGVFMCQDAEKTKAEAHDPLLRVRAINKVLSSVPSDQLPTASPWLVDSEAGLNSGGWGGFSACAYFFAKKLRAELKVPVAVIQTAWGGTLIEPWTPPAGFAQVPALKSTSDWIAKVDADYRSRVIKQLDAWEAFTHAARAAIDANQPLPPPPPAIQHPVNNQGVATSLYNGHIHPLVPYAIRGALWYQGESNLMAGDTTIYTDKMQALVGGWRQVWGQGDFPFYFVQLAPFQYNLDGKRLPEFWEAQAAVEKKVPCTGMAVINDIGDFKDIHPRNKREVGRRLALLALAKTYGQKVDCVTGPQYVSSQVEGGAIRVTFSDCGAGIRSSDGKPLVGFEICGTDGVFVPAEAKTDGSSVRIASDKVPAPMQARFGWDQCPIHNVFNSAGLPMNSFRTPGPKNLALHAAYTCSNPNTHGYGASGQLTDGSWAGDGQHCFASNEDEAFPKDVCVDLGQAFEIARLQFGVPAFGSTKTLVAEISEDGKTFREVGRKVFGQGKEESATLSFATTKARYVRLRALDHHPNQVQYPVGFVFISELEVYER